MKQIKEYIAEAFINKGNVGKIGNTRKIQYTEHPTTKEELVSIIDKRIAKEGKKCDLNDIDVSKITDMSWLFDGSPFNGDISMWDVSNVENMAYMFENSKFNGDISEWVVSNVKTMKFMFESSKFDGNISQWIVSSVEEMRGMFKNAKFSGDISEWDVRNVKDMSFMFDGAKKFNCNLSKWKPNKLVTFGDMFYGSGIQQNPPKWYIDKQ